MKIIVFGASGKTGLEVCKLASKKGYDVIGFDIHKNDQLVGLNNFKFIKGSVLNADEVDQAMSGVDAVVSELGVKIGSKLPLLSEGNKNIISAMHKHKIKRLITQSAFGALESYKKLPFYYKIIHKLLLGPMSKDKNIMEREVQKSDINFTIIRPVRLTNGPAKGKFRTGDTNLKLGLNPRVSRKDVAIFIMDELENNNFIKKAVTITY
ncbi:NAD-dependent epimerase [Candidatus Saccharibacteria bacterium]|nr:NAD-dependent epimerase [Candidatus Saccharibacteria bacterium]